MRHLVICMCLYIASTWTVDIAIATEPEKRSPSAFTEIRGKTSNEETAYSDTSESSQPENSSNNELNDYTQYVSKRVPSGFFGMRGKKPYDGWPLSQDYEDAYKRAPTGFFGLRGKKEMDYNGYFEKRVPNGFFGLRGKKLYDLLNGDEQDYSYDKRVPSGFLGLRGKREFENEWEGPKRAAPENRFFGMRGKKEPNRAGFFGMRGKKYPYEFRGKFVGVRGKKSGNGAPEYVNSDEIPRYGDDLDLNQLMMLLSDRTPEQLQD